MSAGTKQWRKNGIYPWGSNSTPWGVPDHVNQIAEGIYSVSTPSHGGYWVSPERLAEMPSHLRINGQWFEEDCNWCLVAVSFPQFFNEEQSFQAERTMKNWHFRAWERHFGKPLSPGESYKKDSEQFLQDNAENYIVVSAYGAWHPSVPEGFVGCRAALGGNRTVSAESRWFMVRKDRYDARGHFGFVIDPEFDTECEPIA